MLVTALIIATATGTGLMAGLFYVFSAFVMQSLKRISASAAVAAMRSINETIVRSSFLPIFFGTGLGCAAILVIAPWRVGTDAAIALIVASLLYLLGTIGVTIVCNVPLNNRLATIDPDGAEAGAGWREYLGPWLRWNHVRTVSSTLALLLFLVALTMMR